MKKPPLKPSDKSSNPKPSTKKKILWAVLGVSAVILVVTATVNWGTISFLGRAFLTPNYAEQVASPLETALVKAGAVKKCSRGDNGRGMDNIEPNYHAIFEVPVNREAAVDFVKAAAKEAGFNLGPGELPSNPQDNKFYADKTSKSSGYSQLENGNISLLVTIFGSRVYNQGGKFCGVTKVADPPADKTTIDFNINMPSFKQ